MAITAAVAMTTMAPRYTLIVKRRTNAGTYLAEPIYPVTLNLTPLNAAATGTSEGEALRCEPDVEDDVVYLTCGEARFKLTGFRFQE